MKLTDEEIQIIAYSLDMRANWIETGLPTHSAVDLANSKSKRKPNVLDHDQMKFVIKLRELAQRILTGDKG